MSYPESITWLRDATDNFQAAIDSGNLAQAEAVLEDMRDYGYTTTAKDLEAMLQAARVGYEL